MGLLKPVGAVGYLKGGFLGFNKSGKTYTMALLAIGIRRHFGLKGPIAMFDTEGGSEYIGPLVRRLTGTELLAIKSRSLDDLASTVKECVEEEVAVLLAESMTHVWRNLCDSYLAQVNARRRNNNQESRRSLEFQDWGPLKGIWNARWADTYLNTPLHILIAGRAGYEYDMQENEETHRKELVKTGVKMKTEGEFGFEPSLLVEMEREQIPSHDAPSGFHIRRRATVIGDRFGVIDGQTTLFGPEKYGQEMSIDAMLEAVFAFFKPHIALLRPDGVHTTIDTTSETDTGADENGDTDWARERKTRVILCEEIAGALVKHGLDGQSRDEKSRRLEILETLFGTRSWTAIESMSSERLRTGLKALRAKFEPVQEVKETESGEAPGGVSPEEAERLLLVASCEGTEAKLKLKPEFRDKLRERHTGRTDLVEATHDGLLAYREALLAVEKTVTEGGNGKNGKHKPAAQPA